MKVVTGLAAGIVPAFSVGLFFWPVGPVAPFVVGLALHAGHRTAASGTGQHAAVCGILTFLLAPAIVFLVL